MQSIKFAHGFAELAKKQSMSFDQGWKIRVYSPFSNGKPIAFCPLPQENACDVVGVV